MRKTTKTLSQQNAPLMRAAEKARRARELAEMSNANAALPLDAQGNLKHYAFPGGYPIGYLDTDDTALCAKCAQKIRDNDFEWDVITASFIVEEHDDDDEPKCFRADCGECSEYLSNP